MEIGNEGGEIDLAAGRDRRLYANFGRLAHVAQVEAGLEVARLELDAFRFEIGVRAFLQILQRFGQLLDVDPLDRLHQ